MKARIEIMLVLSLYSFVFAIVASTAEIAGALRSDYLGIGMIILSVAQAIIAFIAADIGRRY